MATSRRSFLKGSAATTVMVSAPGLLKAQSTPTAARTLRTVLHGDLHYATVLAAEREPWLAIAPKPLNGDPHYEVAPMLWSRWDDVAGNVRDGVRRRFYTLVDAAGFDEERARAWVIVRVVREAMRDPDGLTRYVAIAKAMLD